MNRYPLWRYILILVLIVIGIIYALPNLYGEDPAIQISNKNGDPLPAQIANQVGTALTAQQIPFSSIKPEAHDVLIRFVDANDQLRAQDVIQATLGEDYSVALNLATRTPAWLLAIGAQPMQLGLDLRGGIHFLLYVDTDALIKHTQQGDIQLFGQQLRDGRVRYTQLSNLATGIQVRFQDAASQQAGLNLLQNRFPNYTFSAQNTNGAFYVNGVVTQQNLQTMRQYAIDQNLFILRKRVNELGVGEPVIQQQGADHISVDLPGIQDSAQAKNIIGKVATIQLQLVDMQADAIAAAKTGVTPIGDTLYQTTNGPLLLKSEAILTGTSIISASSIIGDNGKPAVSVRVSGSEVPNFNKVTGDNVNKLMATVYIETDTVKSMENGKIVSRQKQVAKVINVANIEEALGNSFQITGLESAQYAQNLALLLRSGAYPAPVSFVQERVVGPSLGKENIHMGVLSTEIGSLLVIAFMAFYYAVFGLIADVALLLNIVFIIAILSLLGATLTLPSIAGIVLTVGMAVDANVLINERIREELRNGMSPQAAIAAGYARAFSTIVDANVSTLIVAVVLLALGTGPVQGFAVTLIIGLLTSMVTAIFFTRALVNLTYGRRVQIKKLSIGMKEAQ